MHFQYTDIYHNSGLSVADRCEALRLELPTFCQISVCYGHGHTVPGNRLLEPFWGEPGSSLRAGYSDYERGAVMAYWHNGSNLIQTGIP